MWPLNWSLLHWDGWTRSNCGYNQRSITMSRLGVTGELLLAAIIEYVYSPRKVPHSLCLYFGFHIQGEHSNVQRGSNSCRKGNIFVAGWALKNSPKAQSPDPTLMVEHCIKNPPHTQSQGTLNIIYKRFDNYDTELSLATKLVSSWIWGDNSYIG